jgi:hypothetical protein
MDDPRPEAWVERRTPLFGRSRISQVTIDPLLAAAAATIVTLGAVYTAVGGRFPFTRTPRRFLVACFLAFVVGYVVLAAMISTQP